MEQTHRTSAVHAAKWSDAPLAKPAKKIPPVFTVSFVSPTAHVDSQEKIAGNNSLVVELTK